MEVVEQELISAIRETIKTHLFDTADVVCDVLNKKFNIPKKDIKYEFVNGVDQLTVRVPGAVDKVDVNFTILPEEIIFNNGNE